VGFNVSDIEHQETVHGWQGRVIDRRYRILRPLGQGAMGQVFVAEQLSLHKQVALKVVRTELAGNRELLERFAREALVGSRIDHPSVVAVLDYGVLEEGGAYLVMPLVPGECLAEILAQRGRLPWPEVAELGAQIADALAAAWAQGYVHRDLKPDNILIEPRAQAGPLARVIDFGVAKLFDPLSGGAMASTGTGEPLTKEGTIIGTPGYMAPEQALGRAATHVADLYSLGVVLWEALVGQPRWTGDSVPAILRAQLKASRPSARAASADATIPSALDELVERLVAVRPEQRPVDARVVRDQLRQILQTRAVSAASDRERTLLAPAPAASLRPWKVLVGMLGAGAVIGGLLALAPLEPAPTEQPHAHRRVESVSSRAPDELESRLRARLRGARTCADKRAVLSALVRPGDVRARAALMQISSEPPTGCGPRQDQDCLGCIRSELGGWLDRSGR
jgi:tRNA A-37 threonylcarbamoyl transferase component Bud32